jgi:hypothetical protein
MYTFSFTKDVTRRRAQGDRRKRIEANVQQFTGKIRISL